MRCFTNIYIDIFSYFCIKISFSVLFIVFPQVNVRYCVFQEQLCNRPIGAVSDRVVPGQLSVSGQGVSRQALSQRQRLLSTGPDVVEALGQEDHAGPSLLGFLHQTFTGREVGLLVGGGRHLADCSH